MRVKIIIVILLAMIFYLQYRIWFGEGSYQEVKQLKDLIIQQETENEKLKERNKALDAEVKDLKKGLEAVEERARSELGMVKDGETFYQVIEDPEQKSIKEK